MRHTVVIATRKGLEVLWDSDVPCPWNLRKVIQARNLEERGQTRASKEFDAKYRGKW